MVKYAVMSAALVGMLVITSYSIHYTKLYDKQAEGDPRDFVSLDEALECDLVSFHVPLTRSGAHATHHMLDAQRIAALPAGQILIIV